MAVSIGPLLKEDNGRTRSMQAVVYNAAKNVTIADVPEPKTSAGQVPRLRHV